jgi:hypothetical protein
VGERGNNETRRDEYDATMMGIGIVNKREGTRRNERRRQVEAEQEQEQE